MGDIEKFIGPRTDRTLIRNRKIRQIDGIDVFEDYFSDTSQSSRSSASSQYSYHPCQSSNTHILVKQFTRFAKFPAKNPQSEGLDVNACEDDVEDNIASDHNEPCLSSKVRKGNDKINSFSTSRHVLQVSAVKGKQVPFKDNSYRDNDEFDNSHGRTSYASTESDDLDEEIKESVVNKRILKKFSPFERRDINTLQPIPSTSKFKPCLNPSTGVEESLCSTSYRANAINLISDYGISSDEEESQQSRVIKDKNEQCLFKKGRKYLSCGKGKSQKLDRRSLMSITMGSSSPSLKPRSPQNSQEYLKGETNSLSDGEESDQSTSRQGCIIEKAYNCINDNAVSKVLEVQCNKSLSEESSGFVESNPPKHMHKKNKRLHISPIKKSSSTEKKQVCTRKISKKRKLTTDTVPKSSEKKQDFQLRRSSRMRFAPFESWRNERLLYRFTESGGIETIGVSPGTADCTSWLNKKSKKNDHTTKGNIIQKKMPPPRTTEKAISVIDADTEEITKAKVFVRSTSLSWRKPEPSICRGGFEIAKTFTGDTFIHGILKIEAMKKKPEMQLLEYSSCFTILRGTVEVTIHDSVMILSELDSFVVPAGNFYSLNNLTDSECILSYAATASHIDLS